MNKYFSLDLLRVFAGIWVVAFHTTLLHESIWGISTDWFKQFLMDGHKGVGLFFALSAFLITHSMSKRTTTPRVFLLKRSFKILPLYFTLSVFFFILTKIDALGLNSEFEFIDLFGSLFFLSQTMLSKPPVLYVGWSLEFEILYYLIIYAILIIGNRFDFLILLILIFFCLFIQPIFAYFIVGLLFHHITKQQMNFNAFKSLNIIILYFGLGLCLVYINDYYLSIFLLAAGFTVHNPFKYLRPVIAQSFSFLAAATYSTYLVQVFTIPVVMKSLTYLGIDLPLGPNVLISVSFTLLVGVGFYLVIEKPAEALLSKIVSKYQQP